MKKLITGILALALSLTMAVGCTVTTPETPDEPEHTHTFEEGWSGKDETNHWHVATCGHTDEKKGVTSHGTANGEGKCPDCGYQLIEPHTHTFEEGWSGQDETNHWHIATCGHTDEKKDVTAHGTANGEGKCPDCGYQLIEPHTHTFEEGWSGLDETNHWHVATCGHTNEKKDVIAHGTANSEGKCPDCGYQIFEPEKPEDSNLLNINLSADGYVKGKISDFSVYENTSAYRKVKTADEFIAAIKDAKYHYKNVWDDATNTYTQEPADGYTQENFEGTVHVIEIENDLNLGYYKLSSTAIASGIVDDFAKKFSNLSAYLYSSDMFLENGISQIKVENISNLLIYSKNGAKLTHCGFKLTSDNNVVFRNLEFDEIWQWEDGNKTASKIGDYDWYGWAYFKIAFCGYVWIDHCTFGKSYDGQIDYSNPDYTANAGVAFRAPYGADGSNGLHISWCNFNAGSDDPDGYIYKMMEKLEEEYLANESTNSQHAYYDALRDKGISFEDILYGLAIPQKKGFLCGDSGNNKEDYEYNLKLQISFSNCNFKNIEDRLPKLRGGNAYMYNCVVDSSQYYGYRAKLKSASAASVVSKVKSDWKCALVSQGIVCGNGGSIKAENCIFRGIETLLKNNDSNPAPKVNGGYQLDHCSYQVDASSLAYVGSSSNPYNKFTNSNKSNLKTDYFKWHTEDEEQPFTTAVKSLNTLEEYLADKTYGAGAQAQFSLSWLKSSYTE